MFWYYLPVFLLLATVTLLSIIKQKLTIAGALTGFVMGVCIFAGAGYTGIAMIGLFFVLGTIATSWGFNYKLRLGLADIREKKRTAGQVIANGGAAAIMGVMAAIFPHLQMLFALMMAAALSSATADTLSSELGNVYGRRFYNIVTLQKDTRGLNGVVSLEGTLIGIAGSGIIAVTHALGFGWSFQFFIIIIAGTFGNITDSLLGATLERTNSVTNNTVNLLNTLAAALVALLLYLLLY